jgi:7-cyano-7-deazaguanine synthase in queuosine biosynthesis
MRYTCGPSSALEKAEGTAAPILLFDLPAAPETASAGWSAVQTVKRHALLPDPAAWDLLAIALSVVVADRATERSSSPDGWTRELELEIALHDPARWAPHAASFSSALAFLTTDRWQVTFRGGGEHPKPPRKLRQPPAEAVVLLSGGLDSLIGAIDLTAQGQRLFAVSQTVRGDADKQGRFARLLGGGLEHLQVNHNASNPHGAKETSQRSRSLIFLAFAVLAATATSRYRDGETVPIYVCENGFISINPPLTNARIGSLSTRTAHPEFLGRMQKLFNNVGLNVSIKNPYAEKTKGEMLRECADQGILSAEASLSTSCGRFQRYNYTHCGRCVPCQIRRAAFIFSGMSDATDYVYENLGKLDEDHAAFDDVRSVAMARLTVADDGLDRWLGPVLGSSYIPDRARLREMLQRGLDELGRLHTHYGIS